MKSEIDYKALQKISEEKSFFLEKFKAINKHIKSV